MAPDEPPVGDEEILLRHFLPCNKAFTFPGGPIEYAAFTPSSGDTDGISLFREFGEGHAVRFMTAEVYLARIANPKVREYGGIAAVPVAYASKSGQLTIVPTPSKIGPGHVIIKGTSVQHYRGTKDQKRKVKVLLDILVDACINGVGGGIRILPKPMPPGMA